MSREVEIKTRPRGKGRPRFSREGAVYTPKETKDFERHLREQYKAQNPDVKPSQKPVVIWMVACFKRTKKNNDGYYAKRPDLDNLFKIVADALNGVAYQDDAQIVEAHLLKMYDDSDGLWVLVRDADEGIADPS